MEIIFFNVTLSLFDKRIVQNCGIWKVHYEDINVDYNKHAYRDTSAGIGSETKIYRTSIIEESTVSLQNITLLNFYRTNHPY